MTAPDKPPPFPLQRLIERYRAMLNHFGAILGRLLEEDCTTPLLLEMVITPDGQCRRPEPTFGLLVQLVSFEAPRPGLL